NSYGYPALAAFVFLAAAGLPLPFPVAATFVALGALTTHPDGPSFLALALVATLSASAGHSLDYSLGPAGSPLLEGGLGSLERRPAGAALGRLELALIRRAGPLILLTRCLFAPLASPVSLLAGTARVALAPYLTFELAGEAVYFCVYLTLG